MPPPASLPAFRRSAARLLDMARDFPYAACPLKPRRPSCILSVDPWTGLCRLATGTGCAPLRRVRASRILLPASSRHHPNLRPSATSNRHKRSNRHLPYTFETLRRTLRQDPHRQRRLRGNQESRHEGGQAPPCESCQHLAGVWASSQSCSCCGAMASVARKRPSVEVGSTAAADTKSQINVPWGLPAKTTFATGCRTCNGPAGVGKPAVKRTSS